MRIRIGLPNDIKIDYDRHVKNGIGINQGDILYANSSNCFGSGDLILLSQNDSSKIRKVVFTDDKILYVPKNKNYKVLVRDKDKEDIFSDIIEWGKIVRISKTI